MSTEALSDWMNDLRKTFVDLDLKLPGGESSREAMARGVAVIEEIVKLPEKNIAVVTHGNLMSLILKHYDRSYGFDEWRQLSNPDVYELVFRNGEETSINRLWNMSQPHGMKAVVAGATGMVGRELVRQLLEDPAYSRVTALVRRELGLAHPKLEERIVSFDRLEEEEANAERWQGAEVFCALGTTIRQAGSQAAFRQVDYAYPMALGRIARRYGAAGYVIVTAMGASERSMFFYSRVKGETERDLAALGLPRLVVLRPSLLLGDRPEKRFGERAAIVLFRLLGGLLIGPLAKYRAIEGRDVARAMIKAARRKEPAHEILESDEIAKLATC